MSSNNQPSCHFTVSRFITIIIIFYRPFVHFAAEQDTSLKIAADHHLHIRSLEAARVLKQMDEPSRALSGHLPEAINAQQVIAALDQANAQKGLVLSTAYMFGAPNLEITDRYTKVRAENDYVASQVAAYPSRLSAACSMNPLDDYALKEIHRCSNIKEFSAIKLHLGNSGVDLNNQQHLTQLQLVFQTLNQLQMPVIIHLRNQQQGYGAETAEIFINQVLAQAPDIAIQIAHMGGWGGYDDATDAALSAFIKAIKDGRLLRKRITFGLGAVVFLPEAAGDNLELEQMVRNANSKLTQRIREIGADRVVYATDWPSWPPISDRNKGIQAYAEVVASELALDQLELMQIFSNENPLLVTD